MNRARGMWLLAVAVVAIVFAVACDQFVRHKSVTYDETIYTALAQRSLQRESLDPEIARLGIAPLPVIASHVVANRGRQEQRTSIFWGQAGDAAAVSMARRVHWWVFAIPLLVWVMDWVFRRHGLWWSVAAGWLLIASPTILAHSSLATTDLAFTLTSILAVAGWIRCDRDPSWKTFLLAAALTGVAAASKYSVVMVVPVAAAVSARAAVATKKEQTGATRLAQACGLILLMIGIVFLVAWMLHGFSWAEPSDAARQQLCREGSWLDRLLNRSWPAPIVGGLSQLAHNLRGHVAYALGQHRSTGWWWYFPLAILVKSTLVELLLLMAIVVPFQRDASATADAPSRWWMWFLITVLIVAMSARLNIGHRYVLVLYPLLVLLGVDRIARLNLSSRGRTLVIVVLVGLQLITAALQMPHYLSYFSPWVGGSSNGHRYLADSNLDWGQDLPALHDWMQLHSDQPCAIAYFGTADVGEYAIGAEAASREVLEERRHRYLAVSVTFLQGLYLTNTFAERFGLDPEQAGRLLQLSPAARVGHSIWVFDLEDPAVKRALDL